MSTKPSTTKPQSLRSTGELYSQVWQQLKANPQPLYLYAVVYLFFTLVSAAAQNDFMPNPQEHQRAESLVNLLFISALPLYGLALADKKPMTVNAFTAIKLKQVLYMIGVTVLFAAAAVFSVLALIIPAFWVIAWYTLSSYPTVDQDLPPVQALNESKRLSKDHKGKVWVVNLSVVLASLPILVCDAIPGIGIYVGSLVSAVVTVLIMGIYAALYRDLQKQVKA